ncbi:MAG: PKD domain-containing protein, partial [Nocardioidaceae bacterium]
GSFSRKLIALAPDTGRATSYIKPAIEGQLPGSSTRSGVFRFDVSPSGTRLVAIGNFLEVAGQERARAFMLELGASAARLAPWWYEPLRDECRADGPTRLAYLTDVDFSPRGNYFVIVSTGWVSPAGDTPGRMLCDAAARFETDVSSPSRPTWINYTGGDTLHAVAVTGAAVYVQGHSRWLDNPYGVDSAGPGAVDRLGGGAIDSKTGQALPWNPVMPSRIGGYAFLATRDGLWIGRDGKRIGGEYHRGIAFLPLR